MKRVSEEERDRRLKSALQGPRVYVRPSRPCTTTDCTGTMHLHDPMPPAPLPTHLEFPQYGSWVCAQDPRHIDLLTPEAFRDEFMRGWVQSLDDTRDRGLESKEVGPAQAGVRRRIVVTVSRWFRRILRGDTAGP
jgi:hypothetical protein